MIEPDALNFERRARRDPRMWLAVIAGTLMSATAVSTIAGSGPLAMPDAPLWMAVVFLAVGAAMALGSGVCLIANTSRGCHVDPATRRLTWWQMRYPSQSLRPKHSIALSEIARICVDQSGDSISIKLYDTNGAHRDTFGEVNLPPDYKAWLTALNSAAPNIQIERR